MKKVVFCEVAWMKYYNGVTEDDMPKNGGKYIKEYNDGGEVYNFTPYNHKCYGYVMHKGQELHIERYDKILKDFDEVRDVTVVWVASDGESSKIVGWYENATMFRFWKCFYDVMYSGDRENYYNFIADEKDCYLIDEKDRSFSIPRASIAGRGKGMGQSQVWYAESSYAQKEFIPQVLEYLASMKSKCERIYFTLDEFSERAEDDGKSVDELIEKSIALYQESNTNVVEAIKYLNLAIDKDDCFRTRSMKADLLAQISWYNEAEEEFKLALYHEENVELMTRFMYVELLLGHTFLAIDVGEKIRRRKAEDEVWELTASNLAFAYINENEFDEARLLIEECERDSEREYEWIDEAKDLIKRRKALIKN